MRYAPGMATTKTKTVRVRKPVDVGPDAYAMLRELAKAHSRDMQGEARWLITTAHRKMGGRK